MPDLTTEYFYHCESCEHFSTKVQGSKEYTVSYGQTPRGPYQYDYHCTCDAFKFGKGKPCKHIEEVKASGKHCNWNQFTDGGKRLDSKNYKANVSEEEYNKTKEKYDKAKFRLKIMKG
jgi:hypothetical protein